MILIDIQAIRALLAAPFQMTQHAELRRRQRGISVPDIKHAILTGEIIEDYPDDYPFPSCLILGSAEHGEPLHVVCGVGGGILYVITTYHPSPDKWEPDWKTRKESNV